MDTLSNCNSPATGCLDPGQVSDWIEIYEEKAERRARRLLLLYWKSSETVSHYRILESYGEFGFAGLGLPGTFVVNLVSTNSFIKLRMAVPPMPIAVFSNVNAALRSLGG